ncbi:mitochondrial chaperone BCS1-like [Hydractinia symbiolongicarpus]|uniref:mitochondrial chaperone BCS1-like n=1 Tax=Hydractinia symbiolongicarpus TaxID=13093 RepID=UPI00254F3AB4|nr:mitochondrial chaperone BCS1-like [Hydractinia symbiolongicarpus]
MPLADYLPTLTDNPYFSAGFGLVGVGTGLAILRKGSQFGFVLFRRHCMITLEVPSKDKSYDWMLQWMTQKRAKQTQHLSVMTTFHQHDTGKVSTKFDFAPSPGVHFFKFKTNWIRAERQREQGMRDLATGQPWETVTLTSIGKNKEIFNDMLHEAKSLALSKQQGKTLMYVPMGPDWRQFGFPRQRRPLSSVILDNGIAERTLKDVREFITNQKWYTDRGIPYRRGYLLYGPPGCGKSSFITALAGELEYSICVMNLGDRTLSDDRLNHLMSVAPQQSIILLEDIDAAFSRRDTENEKTGSKGGGYYPNHVTFSGLLNCLDGVVSTEERLVFMTTNYLERLDPALIRPGRVDIKLLIDQASQSQLYRMYLRFYPHRTHADAVTFSDNVIKTNQTYSIAVIQGYFMLHKQDAEAAMMNVHMLKDL